MNEPGSKGKWLMGWSGGGGKGLEANRKKNHVYFCTRYLPQRDCEASDTANTRRHQ
uniref:MIP22355p n=1 Tax=Drosophila melanogaster TaxID=7227 RepID=D6W4P0_DROME|nr:MIP22355p [Drosophila melanogaster]